MIQSRPEPPFGMGYIPRAGRDLLNPRVEASDGVGYTEKTVTMADNAPSLIAQSADASMQPG
jgi:hypothetical protein